MQNNKVFIVGALRIGEKDAFVDNFHAVGYAYPIDVETGPDNMQWPQVGRYRTFYVASIHG